MPNPALTAAEASGLPHRVIRHGPASSLAEAARLRAVAPAGVVKTLVVRRADDDFVFVLVPGDRAISWPKLRRLLGHEITLGAGEHGVALAVQADDALRALDATVADISDPAPGP